MHRVFKLLLVGVILMLFISACGQKPSVEEAVAGTLAAVTEEVPPAETEMPAEEPTAEPVVPPTEVPATEEPTEAPTVAPIVHTVLPYISLPTDKPQVVHDQESIRKAAEKEAYGGDEFYKGRYERPFDQQMTYIPFIDIKQANIIRNEDSEFIFGVIHLMDNPALQPDALYGFGIEMDVDLDGRGDFLIWTRLPGSSEWSVDGVTVWKDANNDIGGLTPMEPDVPPGGDGYEAKLFDSGQGEDPDLAWSRVAPQDPTLIELAFKVDILGDSPVFLWNAWSWQGDDQFGLFDHHDHYTYTEAGSPTKSETAYYPLKAMTLVDNTCRAASGYEPAGNEPGLCPEMIIVVEDPNCRRVCKEWKIPPPTHYVPPTCVVWEVICD